MLSIDPYQLEDVGSLKVDVKVLTSLAVPKLEQQDSATVKQMWNFINEPWGARKSYKVVDPVYKWNGKNKGKYDHFDMLCIGQTTDRKSMKEFFSFWFLS